MHKKLNLPSKICPICKKTFVWRKKWEKNWDSVVYCSDRCRMNKNYKYIKHWLGDNTDSLF